LVGHSISQTNTMASVISSHKDQHIKVWPTTIVSSEDKEQVIHPSVLEGHTKAISQVTVTPHKKLVSVSWDKTIKVWNLNSLSCEQTLTGHTDEILSLTTHKDRFIVTGDFGTNIHVWDLDEAKSIVTMQMGAPEAAVWCLASDYDTKIFAGSVDMKVRVFDIEKKKLVQNLNGHKGHVRSLIYDHQHNHLLYSGSADGTVRIWDLRNKKIVGAMNEIDTETAMCMTLYGDSNQQYLVVGATDGYVRVLDLRTQKRIRKWRTHAAVVTCMTMGPDQYLWTGSSDKMIRVWNPETEDDCKTVVEAGDLVLSLASYTP